MDSIIRNAYLKVWFVFFLSKNSLYLAINQFEKWTIIAYSVLIFLYTLKFAILFLWQIKGFIQNPSRLK